MSEVGLMTDWFRSWHGAPIDPKWLGIARKAGVAPGIAVSVAWALLDRASQAAERGSIDGYDAEGLAYFMGCEPEQVEAIVEAMTAKGILCSNRFKAWEKRQPKREDGAAERAKAWRERKRTQANADEPPESDRETETDTETELDPDSPRARLLLVLNEKEIETMSWRYPDVDIEREGIGLVEWMDGLPDSPKLPERKRILNAKFRELQQEADNIKNIKEMHITGPPALEVSTNLAERLNKRRSA